MDLYSQNLSRFGSKYCIFGDWASFIHHHIAPQANSVLLEACYVPCDEKFLFTRGNGPFFSCHWDFWKCGHFEAKWVVFWGNTCTIDLKTSRVVLAGRSRALGARFCYFWQQKVVFRSRIDHSQHKLTWIELYIVSWQKYSRRTRIIWVRYAFTTLVLIINIIDMSDKE